MMDYKTLAEERQKLIYELFAEKSALLKQVGSLEYKLEQWRRYGSE